MAGAFGEFLLKMRTIFKNSCGRGSSLTQFFHTCACSLQRQSQPCSPGPWAIWESWSHHSCCFGGPGEPPPHHLRARWPAAQPPQAGKVHSLQVRRPGDARQFQPQTAWYWPGGPGCGEGTDSHRVQDGRWLGTSIVLLGLLGRTPRFKSFHTWKESQGWPPTCCLGVKRSSTQTPSPTLSSPPPPHPPLRPGQDWRMRGTGLGPHEPGLGRAVIIWGGSLASCSVPASGKSYVSAKSQESEPQPRAFQSVFWAIAPSTPGRTWVSALRLQQLWAWAPGPLCPGSTQASGASRWQHRKFREGWGPVVVLSPVYTASPLVSAWVVLYDGLGSALTRDTLPWCYSKSRFYLMSRNSGVGWNR